MEKPIRYKTNQIGRRYRSTNKDSVLSFRRDLVRRAGDATRDKEQDAWSVGYSLSHPEIQPRIPRSLRKYATSEALAEHDRKEREYSQKLMESIEKYRRLGICPGCEGEYKRGRTGYIYCSKCREGTGFEEGDDFE